eukprot:2265670-Amphidinium_carterae.1
MESWRASWRSKVAVKISVCSRNSLVTVRISTCYVVVNLERRGSPKTTTEDKFQQQQQQQQH